MNSEPRYGGSCAEFWKAYAPGQEPPRCCSSCHEDAEYYPDGEYPLLEIAFDGKWYDVCCATLNRHVERPSTMPPGVTYA